MNPLITLLALRGYALFTVGEPKDRSFRIKRGQLDGELMLAWFVTQCEWNISRASPRAWYQRASWDELSKSQVERLDQVLIDRLCRET